LIKKGRKKGGKKPLAFKAGNAYNGFTVSGGKRRFGEPRAEAEPLFE
jgi:hypothetical protein